MVEAEEEMNRLEKLEKNIQDSLQKIEENLVASGLALLREASRGLQQAHNLRSSSAV